MLVALYVGLSIVFYFSKRFIPAKINALILIAFAIGGVVISILDFKDMTTNKYFDSIKKYTFQIFLMHTIFAAGARIALLKFGITNYFIHLILGFLASIYIPILVSKISEKIKYTEFFFFPIRTVKMLKKEKVVK